MLISVKYNLRHNVCKKLKTVKFPRLQQNTLIPQAMVDKNLKYKIPEGLKGRRKLDIAKCLPNK